jgi:hypothetical protein
MVAHFRDRLVSVYFVNFILRRRQKLIECNCKSLHIIQIQVHLSYLLLFIEYSHLCALVSMCAFIASYSFLANGLFYIVIYSEVAQNKPIFLLTPQNIVRFDVFMDDM